MSTPETPLPIDVELTGYLDGELDADARHALEARLAADESLRARRDRLAAGRPDAAAFDRLLDDAPHDRLAALLAAAEPWPQPARRTANPLLAIAAALVLIVAGVAAGFGIARFALPPEVQVVHGPPASWREAVAEYLALYTDETLAIIPDDPDLRRTELAAAGERLAIALTPDIVALPGMTLKRTELLDFRGLPLAQIAYLSPEAGPVAFCIIANGKPDAPLAFEERDGFNVGFWTVGGIGYMVIGKIPQPRLEMLATSLESRV